MSAKLTYKTKVQLSQCDAQKQLGIPNTFLMLMDIATNHAETLAVSDRQLGPKGLFWIVVRTKVHFYFRPELMQDIAVTTWPEMPGRVRCVRNYLIESGEKIAVAAKTEWAVIELESGKIQSTRDIYPENLEYWSAECPVEPFSRVSGDFSSAQHFADYTVRSTDIDFGGHMNNAAYIRALMSVFSNQELSAMNITDVEITYKNQCYEGNTLSLYRLKEGATTLIGFLLEDGTVAATVRLA